MVRRFYAGYWRPRYSGEPPILAIRGITAEQPIGALTLGITAQQLIGGLAGTSVAVRSQDAPMEGHFRERPSFVAGMSDSGAQPISVEQASAAQDSTVYVVGL